MFAVCLGLVYFSLVMILGHLSFARPEWLQGVSAWWKGRIGSMELVYDGRCGFCVRSLRWLLAFDGLGQIAAHDFRTTPTLAIPDTLPDHVLFLILPDGRTLPGFEALRHVAVRVPGLWWLIPLVYVPMVSRRCAQLIHDWVTANRSRVAAEELSVLPGAPAQP
jgi:predicted DCC family thiol-disulfide oxidoreductase YuxK